MKKISAVLITYNESDKIERALRSLEPVSDEIVVVDSFSSDSTPELCRRYTDRIIQRSWPGYRQQKQFAAERASHEWILSLDGDEALSSELAHEILEWKKSPDSRDDGYYFPRKAFFMGRWIAHTTWYPDRQLRLFRKNSGGWQGGRIHESVQVTGSVGRFKGEIHHYTYASFSEYLEQLDRFSTLAAEEQWERGRRARWWDFVLHPPVVFLKNYLLRLGFLDGWPGLAVSFMAGTSTLFKYMKLRELELERRTPTECQE